MIVALSIIGWVLGALITSRWTLSYVYEHSCRDDKVFFTSLVGLITLLVWPLILMGFGIVFLFETTARSLIGSEIKKWVTWFYTLDREKRKKVLAR